MHINGDRRYGAQKAPGTPLLRSQGGTDVMQTRNSTTGRQMDKEMR
jgi:hypothetical protein